MPELPEVETICRTLRAGFPTSPSLIGLTIIDGQIFWPRSLETPSVAEFSDRISGQSINQINRRGKFILITLSRDTLLIHLRMSGDLFTEQGNVPIATHHRMVINFQNGLRLAFNDPRKFGRVWLVSDPETVTGGLGPEPLDENFTAVDFFGRLRASRRQLKALLLDQSFLAGLGNIYTDESLHLAHIHPLLHSQNVTEEQAARLLVSIRQVLNDAIQRNGSSIDWVYRGGDFQNYFRAYDRDGHPCPECGTIIQRIKVGQRGTHFCPQCQRLP